MPAPCSASEVIASRFDPEVAVGEDVARSASYAVGIKYRCSCLKVGVSRASFALVRRSSWGCASDEIEAT